MNPSSISQCVNLDCDRKPRYSVEAAISVGGSDRFYVCRGHFEESLYSFENDQTFRVYRLPKAWN